MLQILNLTNHGATPEQQALGLVDPPELRSRISKLLTFEQLPQQPEIEQCCQQILHIIQTHRFKAAHIGGAPFLTSLLHEQLLANGIDVYYSFTQRKSTEKINENGQIEKKSIFCFENFVIFKTTEKTKFSD